jgi:hypothetical protein
LNAAAPADAPGYKARPGGRVSVLLRAVGRAETLAFRPAVAFTRRLRYALKLMTYAVP